MEDTLLEVEKLFLDEYYIKNTTSNQINGNICCDDNDHKSIKTMATNIKRVPKFMNLSDRDICIVLIFLFYSLRLNEQTRDWLKTGFMKQNLAEKKLGYELFIEISTQDIILDGQNFSSAIRRFMSEMSGGKPRKQKTRKQKTRKQKKALFRIIK